MLTLQIGNPVNMGVMSCLGHGDLHFLSSLVYLQEKLIIWTASKLSLDMYDSGPYLTWV